jgi:HSP20 family molecular chaperone IbpA
MVKAYEGRTGKLQFMELGHQVRLISAQYVKAFVRGQKNGCDQPQPPSSGSPIKSRDARVQKSEIHIASYLYKARGAPMLEIHSRTGCFLQENEMMNFVYYQPRSLMDRWQREVAQIFYGETDASHSAGTNNSTWTPSVDLQEEHTRFVLRADVPGVALKDIEVTAEDGTLTIRGERRMRKATVSNTLNASQERSCAVSHCRNLHMPRGSRRTAPMACSKLRSPSNLVSRSSALR